jgi:GNAT superfamily N-acetyltransferase
MTGALAIRRSTPEDAAWVLPLSARLHDFGPPSWRPRTEMDRAVAASIGEAIHAPVEGQVVLIAEDEHGAPAGFIHLHPAVDFFTHETHTHVSDIVVVPAAEGRGVARALMDAADDWARSLGHRVVSLNVFGGNERARGLYERLGYGADTLKMVKLLASE